MCYIYLLPLGAYVEDHQSVIHDTITSPYGRSTHAAILPTSGSATSGIEDLKDLHIHTSNRNQPFMNQAHSLDSIQ